MSRVYIVISIMDSHLACCEAYEDLDRALDRAKQVVSELNDITSMLGKSDSFLSINDVSFNEIKSSTVISRWCLLNTSSKSVFVVARDVIEPSNSKKNTDPASAPLPPDDPWHPELPAGWNHDGEAITMDYLDTYPYSVKPFNSLNYHQQSALVKARIIKRPQFTYTSLDKNILNQSEALAEINAKSALSKQIVEDELSLLQEHLEDVILRYDSSSSEEFLDESESYYTLD